MSWLGMNAHLAGSVAYLGVLALSAVAFCVEIPISPIQRMVAAAANDELNAPDTDAMVIGYYDAIQRRPQSGIDIVAGLTPAAVEGGNDHDLRMEESEAVRKVDGFLRYELKPHQNVMYRGVPLITNRWGQRDADLELVKPAGTFRIALVGASYAMGSGVRYEEAFAYLLEQALDQQPPRRAPYDRYEVINFGVNGYFLFEQLYVIEHKVAAFDPDLVLFCVVPSDHRLIHKRVAQMLNLRRRLDELHYPFLMEIVEEAGIEPSQYADMTVTQGKLYPFRNRLFTLGVEAVVAWSRNSGIPVAALVLHLKPGEEPDSEMAWLVNTIEESGGIALTIFEAYEEAAEAGMCLSATDIHPTPKAHALLADNIHEELFSRPGLHRLLLGHK